MCRFLLAKSKKPFDPQELLEKFADMSKASKALDGDWQGDGWGVSFLDDTQTWHRYSSLSPVWEDRKAFHTIPSTTRLVIHARSASFPTDKGLLEYNQPYLAGRVVFVFNGLLKGVRLPTPVPGAIGAQKIWHMLQSYMKTETIADAMKNTVADLQQFTTTIQALNFGVSDDTTMYVYNQYAAHADYYSLHYFQDARISLITSEPLAGYSFKRIEQQKVIEVL